MKSTLMPQVSQMPWRSRCAAPLRSPAPTIWAVRGGSANRLPRPKRESGAQMEPATATAAISSALAWPVMAVSAKFMPTWESWAIKMGRPMA